MVPYDKYIDIVKKEWNNENLVGYKDIHLLLGDTIISYNIMHIYYNIISHKSLLPIQYDSR